MLEACLGKEKQTNKQTETTFQFQPVSAMAQPLLRAPSDPGQRRGREEMEISAPPCSGGHLGRLWALTAPPKLYTGSCMPSRNLLPEAIHLSYWPGGIAINTASA